MALNFSDLDTFLASDYLSPTNQVSLVSPGIGLLKLLYFLSLHSIFALLKTFLKECSERQNRRKISESWGERYSLFSV